MKQISKKSIPGKFQKIILGITTGLFVSAILINEVFVIGISLVPDEKYSKYFNSYSLGSVSSKTEPTKLVGNYDLEKLASEVIPEEGYTVKIKWGDTGIKLVESGGIDMKKYEEIYSKESDKKLLSFLTEYKDDGITINRENAYFWVNTLWALGLTQKSDVLNEGIMGTEYADRIGEFASTGGWTLGSLEPTKLYSSSEMINLTSAEHKMIHDISKNIFRQCCGNSVAFPDCNHGMAILGLLELMASEGHSEEEMYEAALAFNTYWFGQTYMDLAYYFDEFENKSWKEVEPKIALSSNYSSAQGYQKIKSQIGDTPTQQGSGGCSA